MIESLTVDAVTSNLEEAQRVAARKRLEDVGVKILEETPWIFNGVTFDVLFLKRAAPSWTIASV